MSDNDKYEGLKLERQLCFPLYAVSKEVVKRYKPFLDEINLTYTQYITMMVLWEEKEMMVKDLGAKLFLDSGTLTPVINGLEKRGYVVRRRSEKDKRDMYAVVTEEGMAIREQAALIPAKIGACIPLEPEKAITLYQILNEMMAKF